MLYREGSLFRLRKWHIDGSWPPLGSSDRLPRVASYRMIGPPLPYNVHADVYTRSFVIFIRCLCLTCNFRMSHKRRKKLLKKTSRPHLIGFCCAASASDNFLKFLKFHRTRNSSIELVSKSLSLTRNYRELKTQCAIQQYADGSGHQFPVDALCSSTRVFLHSPVCVYKMYAREGRTEVSKVFAALSLDPWHKGRRVEEENNPATVRWIDMMRTYVDMWGCTRLITPEASWDAERLKRPYPLPSLAPSSALSILLCLQLVYPCFSRPSVSPHTHSLSYSFTWRLTSLPSRRIASPRWDFQTGA